YEIRLTETTLNRPLQMPHIRIIGDAHGKLNARPKPKERNYRNLFPRSPYGARGRGRNYLNLIQGACYSVQVGDLGFDYSALADVDPRRHRVVAGNHDNVSGAPAHFLGDFGAHSFPLEEGSFSFFFVRGAYSVDRPQRVEGVDWWPNEELEESQFAKVVAAFAERRPRVIISHDCPAEIVPQVATTPLKLEPSRTNRLLQMCWETHSPDLWIFGHHHRNWRARFGATDFICLGELGYIDFDEQVALISDAPK
ncbi:MAG: metallophosphoesterase, partial [Planctomycetaceae bacterium]|nr:metallophosphoesterase [Planctomycetaceae bacterium]